MDAYEEIYFMGREEAVCDIAEFGLTFALMMADAYDEPEFDGSEWHIGYRTKARLVYIENGGKG